MTINDPLEQLRNLLGAYLVRVTALKLRFAEFVVSNDVRRFICEGALLPLLIVVADNPGAKEHTYNEFLSAHGNAGRIARGLLEAVFGAEFLRQVLILNKSNYSTSRTTGLSKLLCNVQADTDLQSAIRTDQEENGKLVRQLATLLQVPVVTFGWEADSETFAAFRAGHGQLIGRVAFKELTVQQSQIVPHASFRRCYRPIGGENERAQAWDGRLKAFLQLHKDVPGLCTEFGAISEKTLRKLENPRLWLAYFTTVILGANQSA